VEFVRKKKRGVTKKVYRLWLSAENYRVVWRREVFGVCVPARFQACVRVMIPNYAGKEDSRETVQMWDFLFKPKLYKTLKAAQDDCERHCRLWSQACEATGARSLIEIFGKLPNAIPTWVRKRMNRKALAILLARRARKYADEEDECETSQSDPTPILAPSDAYTSSGSVTNGSQKTQTSGPASSAADGVGTTIQQPRRVQSKATKCVTPSVASPAKEPAAVPAKQSRKHTKRQSSGGGKKRTPTTRSSKSAKKPSANSRKKKSTPSKS